MTKIYGYSDDIVEIENNTSFDEVNCYNKDVFIILSDGVRVKFSYLDGVWKASVINKGNACFNIDEAKDADSDNYSDVFTSEADIVSVRTKAKK